MISFEEERDRDTMAHLEKLRKGLVCQICGNFLRDAYNLPCGHNFCLDCVDEALAERSMCPSCKNPAWSKDTVKSAQTDSAVHDWVNQCEATYQAFVARIAQYDEDGTDSVVSEVSGEALDNDDAISLHAASPAPPMPSTPSDKADAESPISLGEASAKSAAGQEASRSQIMREDGVTCTSNLEASRSQITREDGVTCTSNLSCAATGALAVAASADTTSVDTLAASDTIDCRLSTAELEGNTVPPLSLRMGSPIAAAAVARSPPVSSGAEENPVSERASAAKRRPLPFSTDRYDRQQTADGLADADAASARCYPAHLGNPQWEESNKGERKDGAAAGRSEDENGTMPGPEVAQSNHNNIGDFPTSFPPIPRLVTGRDRQRSPSSPPSRQRCSETTPLQVTTDREEETAAIPLSFSRFAESLPDTCDVFGQDSPAQAPARSSVLIATPPALPSSAAVQRLKPARLDSVFGDTSDGLSGVPDQDPDSDGEKMRCAEADVRSPVDGVPIRGVDISQQKALPDASFNHHQDAAEASSPQESSFGRPGDGEEGTHRNERNEGFGDLVDTEGAEHSATHSDEPPSKGRGEQVFPPGQSDDCGGSAAGGFVGVSLREGSRTHNDDVDDEDATRSASSSSPMGVRHTTKPAPPNASVDTLVQLSKLADKNVGDGAVKPESMLLNNTTAEEDTEEEACDTPGAVSGALEKCVQQHVSSTFDSPTQRSVPLIPAAHLPCPSPVSSPLSGKVTSPLCGADPRLEQSVTGNFCNQMRVAQTDADNERCSGSETGSSLTMALDSPGSNENKDSTVHQEGGALYQLAELASLERMAPSQPRRSFPDGVGESSTTGTPFNEFPTDGDSRQATPGSVMKETAAIIAGDHNNAAGSGLHVRAGVERPSSRPTSGALDAPLTKPVANEGDEDEDSSTIAADDEPHAATPSKGSRDALRNLVRVCEPPMQDVMRESRGQRGSTEGETIAKSGESLCVSETLAPNSVVTCDLVAEEDKAPSPAKQRDDKGWLHIPESVPETAGIGTYAQSEVPETLPDSSAIKEANERSFPSEDVHGDGRTVHDSPSVENNPTERSYGEATNWGKDSDLRRMDLILELGAAETASGDVGGHGPTPAPQVPAVAETTVGTSETGEIAATEGRDVQQNNNLTESLEPTTETALAHSLSSQEVPETVLSQDMPDTPLSDEVAPHVPAVSETTVGKSETDKMAAPGRRDAQQSKNPKEALEPTSETAPAHSLPSQEVPETMFLEDVPETLISQEVPETPLSPEVAKTADIIAAAAKDRRDTTDSGDEMRNDESPQESNMLETPQLLPAGATDSQSTIDDTIGAGAGDIGAQAMIKKRKHDIPPTESPDSARKRSADSVTLSPEHFESRGKRLKETRREETSPIRDHTPERERVDYASDTGAPNETNEVATGPPLVLRGGGGSGGSDDEVVFEPSPDFPGTAVGLCGEIDGGRHYGKDGAGNAHGEDLTADNAVDDSHVGNIFYEMDDGSSTPPPRTTEVERSASMSSTSVKSVSNPYEHSSHLEIQPDVECTFGPSWNNSRKGATTEGNGQTPKVKGNEALQKNSRRPTSAMMGFGAPSQGNRLARGPSVFGNGAIDTRRKENACRASSNTILAAGRSSSGRRFGAGGASSAGQGSVNGIANYSTCEETPPSYLVPNTQDVDELEAGFAALDGRAPRARSADMKVPDSLSPSLFRAVSLAESDTGPGSSRNGRLHWRERTGSSPVGKKRPRSSRNATAGMADASGRRTRRETSPSVDSSPVVLVFLGCQDWELKRATLLCQKLRQSRLHTELTRGVTHVVLGSSRTAKANGDDDGSDNDGPVRRELSAHGLDGYLEAVMLGLWVLDFSWVEACLKGGSGARKWTARHPSLHWLAPARDFEIVGCLDKHDGCIPRRGRMLREDGELWDGFVGPHRLFSEHKFCIVVGAGQVTRTSLRWLECDEYLKLVRLLKLGDGHVFHASFSSARPALARSRGKELKKGARTWSDEPLASEHESRSGDDGSSDDETSRRPVVVALVEEEAGGKISPQLERAALECMKDLKAAAAVTSEWVVRSIEEDQALDFDQYSVQTRDGRSPCKPPAARSTSLFDVLHTSLAPDLTAAGDCHSTDVTSGSEKPTGEQGPQRSGAQRIARRASSTKLRLRRNRNSGSGGSRQVVINLDNTAGHGSRTSRREMPPPSSPPPLQTVETSTRDLSEDEKRLLSEVMNSGDAEDEDRRRMEREQQRKAEASSELKLTRVGGAMKVVSEDVQIGGADFWNRDYKQEFCEAGIDMNEPKPNYSELNKSEKSLWEALEKVGYLELPGEQTLGEFWYDHVHDGGTGSRGEKWEKAAKERGCPLKVIRDFFIENGDMYSNKIRQNIKKMENEKRFHIWEPEERKEEGCPAPDAEAAVEAGAGTATGGASVDDALEVL